MSPDLALARLPASPILRPGQALDCYLEHVAEANYLPAGTLMATITAATDTTRYLLLRPTPRTVAALSGLTGATADALNAATLAPLDGTLVDLAGLNPHDQPSYRAVAARGWAPGQGSQICPRCLAETGTWDIAWRLPMSTVCLRHQNYLLATCPGCQRPFRATRSTVLRPIGATTRCGNALGRRGRYCPTDLTVLPTHPADPECLQRQARADPRTNPERAPQVLGVDTTDRQFIDDIKSLTALLLHIATATARADLLPHWTKDVNEMTHAQTRAPRWSIRPPDDIPTRSRALTAATEILTSPDLETALTHFTPWVQAVPPTPDGFLGWAPDHMRPTEATTRLVMAAHAPRRRLSSLGLLR